MEKDETIEMHLMLVFWVKTLQKLNTKIQIRATDGNNSKNFKTYRSTDMGYVCGYFVCLRSDCATQRRRKALQLSD